MEQSLIPIKDASRARAILEPAETEMCETRWQAIAETRFGQHLELAASIRSMARSSGIPARASQMQPASLEGLLDGHGSLLPSECKDGAGRARAP
jgi:hypothetical protein